MGYLAQQFGEGTMRSMEYNLWYSTIVVAVVYAIIIMMGRV